MGSICSSGCCQSGTPFSFLTTLPQTSVQHCSAKPTKMLHFILRAVWWGVWCSKNTLNVFRYLPLHTLSKHKCDVVCISARVLVHTANGLSYNSLSVMWQSIVQSCEHLFFKVGVIESEVVCFTPSPSI
ncbi:unnamed protein product [Ixodes pacificus]